ncbi:hypothetical protein [Pseudomonas phage K4]|nr:hypothetical protein BJD45_gp69 [Pseudomonas phage O4]AMO43548.1 hypothetical protein O4_73 [Pseudomonas phage O4]ATG86308.1 hypothetical protein [Pseudomonas phage IME180]QWS69955.1 hypothetical protein [Pseudomonas phage K4]
MFKNIAPIEASDVQAYKDNWVRSIKAHTAMCKLGEAAKLKINGKRVKNF